MSIVNLIVLTGVVLVLGVVIASWLMSYRDPRDAVVGSRRSFLALPLWAQIVLGLAALVLLAALGYWLWIPLPLAISPEVSAILTVGGLTFFLVGCGLALWARWALGTMYGVSTGGAAPLQMRHRLIQHGPYAWVRHPMYLGYWLVLLGVTLIYQTWTPLLFLVMSIASFYRRARREESALAERFGEEWHAYALRTKFLIPFVY